MIKIGDKVKFDEYIPYNYMTGSKLIKTLKTNARIGGRQVVLDRGPQITTYKTLLIGNKEPLVGIYIGSFKKKLNRSYRRSEPGTERTLEERLRDIRQNPSIITLDDLALSRIRPSKSPNRLDDPRKLDKMAMLRVGGKMIGVPMSNIFKCNYTDIFKVI